MRWKHVLNKERQGKEQLIATYHSNDLRRKKEKKNKKQVLLYVIEGVLGKRQDYTKDRPMGLTGLEIIEPEVWRQPKTIIDI